MKKKNLFLIILILFVFLLLFFHRFFIYGELLFYGDVYWYFIPVRKIISEYIINFKIPLWLNSLNCGFPIFSAAQYGIFNPLQFIFYFLKEQELAYTLLVIISYIILYFSSYIYFKHKFKSIIISIFCSSLFSFFGFNLLSYLYVPLIVAISLLPLSFYCIEKYVNSLQKKYLCFIGLIISFQILNGHPQIPFINIIGLFFHTLILLFLKKEKINKYLYFYSALILVLLLAFGIAAIQILPLYQLSKYSVRAHTDLSHSIPLYPHSLISFVFYNFFGSDAENSFIGPPFGSGNELYTGILTIFFFIISIKNLNKKKSIKYYLFLFIFFLLIALGRFSPIYFIIKNIFIFKKFRAISRFVLLVNFYQIIISGYGLLFFLQSYKKRKIKFSVFNLFISLFVFLFLIFGLVVYFQKEYILQKSFIYLKEFSEGKAPEFLKAIEKGIRTYPIEYYYGKLKRYLNTVSKHLILQMCLIIIFFKMFYVFYKKNIKIFYLLILIFIIYFLDAYFFSKNFFVFINKNFYSEKPKTLDKLLDIVNIDKTKSMYYRFFSLNRGIMHLPFKYYFGFANDLLVFEHLKNFIYRNTGLNYKLNLFYGEDTLEFRRLYQMKSLIKIGWFNLLKFSSTKYIFTDSLLPESHFEFKNCENNVYFYTFKNPLPHFYFANNYLVIKDENEILKKLNDESINFENTIIIEEEEEFKLGGEIKGKIENLKYSDNEKVFFVKLDKPAFFILTDSFFPAWNCFVNNKKTKIYLTNYLFQSVYLPAGEHKIEFIYNDEFFKIGKYISFVSIVIIIFILIKREEKL